MLSSIVISHIAKKTLKFFKNHYFFNLSDCVEQILDIASGWAQVSTQASQLSDAELVEKVNLLVVKVQKLAPLLDRLVEADFPRNDAFAFGEHQVKISHSLGEIKHYVTTYRGTLQELLALERTNWIKLAKLMDQLELFVEMI